MREFKFGDTAKFGKTKVLITEVDEGTLAGVMYGVIEEGSRTVVYFGPEQLEEWKEPVKFYVPDLGYRVDFCDSCKREDKGSHGGDQCLDCVLHTSNKEHLESLEVPQ